MTRIREKIPRELLEEIEQRLAQLRAEDVPQKKKLMRFSEWQRKLDSSQKHR